MAGPDNQRSANFIIPAGESSLNYTAKALTQKIVNFEFTIKRTLSTVVGPTVYEPDRPVTPDPAAGFGQMHGIFHTTLLGGQMDLLLVRSGDKLYRHAGWQRGWEVLHTGLTSDTRGGSFPDQFVVVSDKVVWCNGIDQPLVIDAHGTTTPLGFNNRPAAPSVFGPGQFASTAQFYPNASGYSWRGDIGTPGDVLSGVQGAILDGAWYYYAQFEDIYGNLSAPSIISNAAWLRTIQANPYDPKAAGETTGATIDDLTRQFFVRLTSKGPEHTVATHIFRTPDTRRASTKPRRLVRLPGREPSVFGDRRADSDLGEEMEMTVSVPTFRTMCVHEGRLVIANTPADPGIVRISEPGFPGTFLEDNYTYPDVHGADVTAVASHMGMLLAFTEGAVYDITPDRDTGNLTTGTTLIQGIGCTAPRSIAALYNGNLIFLGRDGFYSCDPRGRIQLISDDIHKVLNYDMNTSKFRRAVSVVDPVSREYHCAVPIAGTPHNRITFCYDGQNWRRHDFEKLSIDDITVTEDYRQLVLFVGKTIGALNPAWNVFVKDRETSNYEVPARTAYYRSGWFFGDDTGSTFLHVRTLYLGMLDSWNDKFTIRFFRNNSWKPVIEMTDVLAIGVDDDSDVVRDAAGSAIIGEARVHEPRLFWRMVPVGLENAYSWAFEIEAAYPTRLNLASVAYDVSAPSGG
ncbi:MAG: hypothetical protein ACO28P_09985, partial [Ilumatobacteraceae bacterium]